MKCTRPVLERCKTGPIEIVERPCGVCPACRATKAQNWTYRLYCESKLHEKMVFVTLTYDEEHVKKLRKSSLGLYSLRKKDMQIFMKSIRKISFDKLRFFGVGEYGEHTHRPHFHLIIFGLGEDDVAEIQRAWNKGFVKVGSVTPASIAYVARYCTKKLLDEGIDDPDLEPEFNLQSNRPGIGFGAIDKAVMRGDNGNLYCWYEGRRVGLPKYFKEKVRTAYEQYLSRLSARDKRDDIESVYTAKELLEKQCQRERNILAARRARKGL